VNHTVTINHSLELPVTLISSTLENAGYELDSILADPRSPEAGLFADIDLEDGRHAKANEISSSWPLSLMRRSNTASSHEKSLKRKRHVENCDVCQRAEYADNSDSHAYDSPKKLLRPTSMVSVSTASSEADE